MFTLKYYTNFSNIWFDGIPIEFVKDHKHLGLTLNNKGQWHKHIENIVSSASKVIGIMRKLKYTFHRVALNQILSSIVWDNCTVQDSSTLDKLQNENARIVTG